MDALEEEVKRINHEIDVERKTIAERFVDDGQAIGKMEEATAVTQRALLALLSHAINGNDIESLKRAKSDLEDYLTHINK